MYFNVLFLIIGNLVAMDCNVQNVEISTFLTGDIDVDLYVNWDSMNYKKIKYRME